MTSNLDFSDGLLDLAFDPRDPRYPFANMAAAARSSWPMPLEMAPGSADERQAHSPPGGVQHSHRQQFPQAVHSNSPTLLTDWPMQQQQPQPLPQYIHHQEGSLMGAQYNTYGGPYQTSPLDYHHQLSTTQAGFEPGLQMEAPFNGLVQSVEAQAAMWANWQELENAMMIAGAHDGLPNVGRQSLGSHSPTGTYLEVLSLPSSSSDHGWNTVDSYPNFESYQQAQGAAIFNPGQTLHLRSHSDSSQSDGHTIESFGSFEDMPNPYSPYSPGSDTYLDLAAHRNCYHGESHHHVHEVVSPAAAVAPVPIKMSPSTRASPSSTSSPPARRNSAPKKSPTAKATKAVIRRTSNGKKGENTEKRVGRRRGPLLPEQRKQASEIRKLRACLRCKFLKKTCDKGEPCAGCQPSHARLWQVPCTRIDIKDIGYFMKDWRADYQRHMDRGISIYNIKGFAQKEELLWITHGYGFALPIMAREVYVSDDSCFSVDWTETSQCDEPLEFDYRTDKMSAGAEGVSTEALSEYLDKHLDGPFEEFVDEYFEGTPFITEILKTAHRYYVKEKVPVIRKALKLVLAYNLTYHVTLVEQRGDEHPMIGMIDDEESRFAGKIIAPVMINFQIKCALADMWRELQKDILEELSSLYSSVYSGDRLKNWPTIFMIASILLAVWEEMQFDCHYRVPDSASVNKFCSDMETTPVGVIVGLFHAISQKLPPFTEWETRRHGQLLNNNVAVCEAMTEMREHVTKHESYLKTRPDAQFDSKDFDSLSNKFLSKLVIRAN